MTSIILPGSMLDSYFMICSPGTNPEGTKAKYHIIKPYKKSDPALTNIRDQSFCEQTRILLYLE